MPVVYINFELHRWAIGQRLTALAGARPECKGLGESLALWNLRGRNGDLALLRPKLEEQLARHEFGLIILDPAYKLLGDRDENANGEIAGLMNEFEAMAQSSGAAVVVAHHFAKGDSTSKEAMDRMSGAGAWARDPDSIVVLTPHEEPDCFTVNTILRNLPRLPEFVVAWEFPRMQVARDLNPEALRRPQAKNKVCTDREFVERWL
jgi:RecA-family ATPase